MTHDEYIKRRDEIFSDDTWVLKDHPEWLEAIDKLVDDAIQYTVDEIAEMSQKDGYLYSIVNHPYGSQRQIVRGS